MTASTWCGDCCSDRSRSRYFLITGQAIDAEEALRLGVVHEILPAAELHARAWEIATDLALRSRAALRFTKAAVSMGMRLDFAEDLSHGMGVEGSGHWVDGGIRE